MTKVLLRSHILTLVVSTGLLVFVSISIYYIACFHVSPLSRDQWEQYLPFFEHGLWDAALKPMSGVNRYVFPYLLFDIDMEWFGGNNHFLIFFGSALNALTIFLLSMAVMRDPSLLKAEKQAFLVLIMAALLWLVNIAQLGWGFMSTQYYLAIFSTLFAVFSAHEFCRDGKPRWLVCCLVSGTIGTFSFGMGILIWPILLLLARGWRASRWFVALVIVSLLACLTLFLCLPGSDTIANCIKFLPKNTVAFVFQLASGPVYYFLRSYHVLGSTGLKWVATSIGMAATAVGILVLIRLWLRNTVPSLFSSLCIALMLCGLGSGALISLARVPFFLDVWVDRFQIWATLFWLGFLPLLYLEIKYFSRCPPVVGKIVLGCLCCFPLVALPSQLDMGVRLSEYKIRVQQALLSYQVGIPDKNAAEEALHWNWENKLDAFFTVLNYLKIEKKNIYTVDDSRLLGQPVQNLNLQHVTPVASLDRIKTFVVAREDLLALDSLPAANSFVVFNPPAGGNMVAYQLAANVTTQHRWTHALITNESGRVIGLGIMIHHSLLPRSQWKFVHNEYNLYAVVRNDHLDKLHFYFLDENNTDTAQVSEAVTLPMDSSR